MFNDSPKPVMSKLRLSITKQAFIGLATLAVMMWLALFLPAGSFIYWQGWLYWLTFTSSVSVITAYFLRKDLTLIANRLKAGPTAEKERSQQITQTFAAIFFILLLLVPPFDFRFHWSTVPWFLVLISNGFVIVGLSIVFVVFRENSYTSAIIEVNASQEVISTGPYHVVRHPMYSGALLMLLFTPMALGSFFGVFFFFPILLIIMFRLIKEEKFLAKNLVGYLDYMKKTRRRLIPFIW
jgi:protein-S-isoprenylcysteine O-methyltransferase Ste14